MRNSAFQSFATYTGGISHLLLINIRYATEWWGRTVPVLTVSRLLRQRSTGGQHIQTLPVFYGWFSTSRFPVDKSPQKKQRRVVLVLCQPSFSAFFAVSDATSRQTNTDHMGTTSEKIVSHDLAKTKKKKTTFRGEKSTYNIYIGMGKTRDLCPWMEGWSMVDV